MDTRQTSGVSNGARSGDNGAAEAIKKQEQIWTEHQRVLSPNTAVPEQLRCNRIDDNSEENHHELQHHKEAAALSIFPQTAEVLNP